MNNKISIKFWYHTYKNKEGKQQLYIRTRQGMEISKPSPTGMYHFKKYWDNKEQRLTAEHPNHTIHNKAIAELKVKMETALSKTETEYGFGVERTKRFLEGIANVNTLDEYVETHYKKEMDNISYTNYRDRLRYFKAQLNIKRDLRFDEIDNLLIKKYKRIVDKKILNEEGSRTTYKSYLEAVLSICNEAFDNGDIEQEIKISKRAKKLKTVDYGDNKSNSVKDLKEAIENITTIQRWEAVAQWLLMFGMRGFYPADIVKMGENLLMKDSGDKDKRMPYVKVTSNRFQDWRNLNLYLDYRRSKTSMPMFIKLKRSVLWLIEKLKYSYMFTHADYKIGDEYIVSDVNERLNIINYNIKDNNDEHKNFWRNRGKLLKETSDKLLPFKYARKTFYQLADDLSDELTAKKLVGQTTDKLSKEFYSKYNTRLQVEKLDKIHDKVLEAFDYDLLVLKMLEVYDLLIKNGKAPKWLNKDSSVLKLDDGYRVVTRFNNKSKIPKKGAGIQYEFIPKKYWRFFDDKSAEDGYWEDFDYGDSTEELNDIVFTKIKVEGDLKDAKKMLEKNTKVFEQKEQAYREEQRKIKINKERARNRKILMKQLEEALQEENYEGCAEIRDKMKEQEYVY